jgi:hypothetical protein
MARVRDVRGNSGIIAGRDVSNSSVVNYGPAGAASEDELREELNDLIAELLKEARQLPAADRGAVRSEIVQFQEEIESPAPDRDRGRIAAALERMKSAVAVVAPLAEIVKAIAEITAQLVG